MAGAKNKFLVEGKKQWNGYRQLFGKGLSINTPTRPNIISWDMDLEKESSSTPQKSLLYLTFLEMHYKRPLGKTTEGSIQPTDWAFSSLYLYLPLGSKYGSV